MYLNNLGGIWAAYLSQLTDFSSVCNCKNAKAASGAEENNTFSAVLQGQKARQLNQERYTQLKEAAGGKTEENTRGDKNNTLLQYQRLFMNRAFLSPYGLGGFFGGNSFL